MLPLSSLFESVSSAALIDILVSRSTSHEEPNMVLDSSDGAAKVGGRIQR